MAFQGTFDRPKGVYEKVIDVTGADLLGTKVCPPFGVVKEVYVLPMEGVLATKVSLFLRVVKLIARVPESSLLSHQIHPMTILL